VRGQHKILLAIKLNIEKSANNGVGYSKDKEQNIKIVPFAPGIAILRTIIAD
jgi:hypothetical protein